MGFGTWMKEQRELALEKKAELDAAKAAAEPAAKAAWELAKRRKVETAAKAVAFTALAGPLGLLAAGSRTNGKITVTWMKQG